MEPSKNGNNSTSPTVDQWLIRTADNWLAGPYLKEQVRRMVVEGKLTLQDEVCQGNSYWIYLHEYAEVQKLLGVQVPKSAGGDEITETQIPKGAQAAKKENERQPQVSASSDAPDSTMMVSSPKASEPSPKSTPGEKTNTGTIVRKSIFEPLLEQVQAKGGLTRKEEPLVPYDPQVQDSSYKYPPEDGKPGKSGLVWMMVIAAGFLVAVIARLVFNR